MGSVSFPSPQYLLYGSRDLLATFRHAITDPWIGLFSKETSFRESVPTFYGGFLESIPIHYLVIQTSIGVLFGSIHIFAWAFEFPSRVEKLLWQTMSLSITVSPLLILIPISLGAMLAGLFAGLMWFATNRSMDSGSRLRTSLRLAHERPDLMMAIYRLVPSLAMGSVFLFDLSLSSTLFVCFIYSLSRLSTFILAFLLLRDLPAGALVDVHWSKFVPHF